jgi:hypothetical protein
VINLSHFETGVVSYGILGLLASWTPLPALSLAECPEAEYSLARLVLFLSDGTERHRFCSLSIEDAEQHRKDSLCCGWIELSRAGKGMYG